MDGTDDQIDITSLNLGDAFTVAFWIYPESSTSTWPMIFTNSAGGSATDGLRIFYFKTDNEIVVETGNGGANDNDRTANSSAPFDQWVHVACVIDRASGTSAIYLNGVYSSTDGTVLNDFKNSGAHYIGASINTNRFQGIIDDMRVYNRLLTQSEVQLLSDISIR